jgi:hypothetical protein
MSSGMMKEVDEKEKEFRQWIYQVATENNKRFLEFLWTGHFDKILTVNIFRISILYILEPLIIILLYYFNSSKELKPYIIIPKIILYIEIIYLTVISLGILATFSSMKNMDIHKATIYYREISPKSILRFDTIIRIMIISALVAMGNIFLAVLYIASLILLEIANYSIPSQLYRIARTDFTMTPGEKEK